MEYKIGRARKVEHGPWSKGNKIIEIWADRSHHSTKYDLRISPHDGPIFEGGRRAAVFDSTTGKSYGPVVRVPGLFRRNAARRAGELLERDENGKPCLPYRANG